MSSQGNKIAGLIANLAEHSRRHWGTAHDAWNFPSYALADEVWNSEQWESNTIYENLNFLTNVPPIPYQNMIVVLPPIHISPARAQDRDISHVRGKFMVYRYQTGIVECFMGFRNNWIRSPTNLIRGESNWGIHKHKKFLGEPDSGGHFSFFCAALTIINDPRATLTLPPLDRETARFNSKNRRFKPIPPTHILTIDKSQPRVVREDYVPPGTGRQKAPHLRSGHWATRPRDIVGDCEHNWQVLDDKHAHCNKCQRLRYWTKDARIHGGNKPKTYVITATGEFPKHISG